MICVGELRKFLLQRALRHARLRQIVLPVINVISILLYASMAGGDVSGFEHLKKITIDCGPTPLDGARLHDIKTHHVCSYGSRLCKIMNNNEFQIETLISIDCEVKESKGPCPEISICAKPNQLSKIVADEVRKLNDPNFLSSQGGSPTPIEKLNTHP